MSSLQPHLVILAAGKGKRMYSKLPKVLHPVLFRPMIHYVLDLARALPHASISMIVGHGEEQVREACRAYGEVKYFRQAEQRGTAHAVQQAEPFLREAGGHVIVLSGDVILLTEGSMRKLLATHETSGAACTVLTAKLDEPRGYGRILRNTSGGVTGIREEVDCSETERAIREVNSGIYCFRVADLLGALGKIGDANRQKEFYLTDAVALLASARGGVTSVVLDDSREMAGINDRLALHEVEAVLQARVNRELMLKGVAMRSPSTTLIDPTCRIEPDVVIEGGTVLIGSRVAAGAIIEGQCRIMGSEIGEGAHIKQGCYIQDSHVSRECTVGPYAHLRPGSRLEAEVKIGNFVELKKATMGRGAKASHLSYIGDAEIGAGVNLGCGFITCNFDGGPKKHRTVIEDDVFVGSDSQMVAPVRLGKGSYIASGSTITRDVPAGALAIARVKQVNKEGYATRLRERASQNSGSVPDASRPAKPTKPSN